MSRLADAPALDSAAADEGVIATGPPARVARRHRSWVVAVAGYFLTIFVLVTLNFAIPRLMPSSPIDALMAFGSPTYVDNDQTRADLAKYYGLDESIPAQYAHYLGRLAHGDLGRSIFNNRPVRTDIGGRSAWTFLLLISGTLISMLIGIPLGINSGWKRGKRVDKGLLGFFLGYQNLPVIILATISFVFFAGQLGIFPFGGGSTDFSHYTGITKFVDVGQHLILPALLLGLDLAGYEYLVMRSSMVSELGADYLLGGRAKGLKERRLKYNYAARNALLPVVSVIGLQFTQAIFSVILIERIFNYPGLGTYMFGSIGERDYPALQGSFLVITLSVVTVNLLVDLTYRRLDPRTTT